MLVYKVLCMLVYKDVINYCRAYRVLCSVCNDYLIL